MFSKRGRVRPHTFTHPLGEGWRQKGKKPVLATTKPISPEEAEALKTAPPWAGVWATKPTLRQRIMLWVKYLWQ